MSKNANIVDGRADRSQARGRGKSIVMAGLEMAMGVTALGIFAEAAFVAYCGVLAASSLLDAPLADTPEPV
jgi:hypothetical protein